MEAKKAEWEAMGQTAHPFRITSINQEEMNYLDGVPVSVDLRHMGEKVIKYLTVWVKPYNSVGDPVKSTIGGRGEAQLEITGPISGSYYEQSISFNAVWYNSTTTCLKLTKVKVEYMDGSSYTYVKELSKIIDTSDGFDNTCPYVD